MLITPDQRIQILTARLINLKAQRRDMTISERVEAIKDAEAALQFAIEELARMDSQR